MLLCYKDSIGNKCNHTNIYACKVLAMNLENTLKITK